MCSHIQQPPIQEIESYLKDELQLPLVKPTFSTEAFETFTEVYPKRQALVLLYQNDQLQLQVKNWGYPSPFKQNQVLNNARIERFYEAKPSMWDSSFARQRCIVITSQFFESSRSTYTLANGKKYHEEFSFKASDYPMTFLAGIYDSNYFALATTSSNETVLAAHPRMPLVISPAELRRWLFQNFTSLIDRTNFPITRTLLPHRQA